MSESDRTKLGLPILRISKKSKGKYVTRLPFKQLSSDAAQSDTFEDFPTSLMSMGKTSDDGNISVFTKDGVSVYNE